MVRLIVKTIVTPSALRRDLANVREQGYAVDDEEHAVGLRCVAAPIFDETGQRSRPRDLDGNGRRAPKVDAIVGTVAKRGGARLMK